MKKIVTSIILSAFALGLQAQHAGHRTSGDTTKLTFDKVCIWIFENKSDTSHAEHKGRHEHKPGTDFGHWGGIDLGVNGYLTWDNKTMLLPQDKFMELNYGRSIHVGWNFYDKQIHLYKNYAVLSTGLGAEWNSYQLKHDVTLIPDSNITRPRWDSAISYTKNKLRLFWVSVPLMIELNSSNKDSNKSFHVGGGVLLSYLVGSKTKQEYEMNGYEVKIKKKDDYNLAPFRYCATVRAGYGNFTLFANYALSELFQKGRGPQLYPFSVGVNISM